LSHSQDEAKRETVTNKTKSAERCAVL